MSDYEADIPEEAAEIVLAYAPEAIREAIRQLDHDMFGEAYETKNGQRLDPALVTPICHIYGSPTWWSDYSEFSCELPEGHEGQHRMTIEWEDPR